MIKLDKNVRQFLGRGWKFPIRVDKNTGRIEMSEYEEDIMEAVRLIVMTRKGERVMQPQFGSDAYKFVFGTNEVTTNSILTAEIKESLIQWEPRIKDIEVDVSTNTQDPEKLLLNISYIVRTTNNPFNLVYPFYINEGMG